MPPNSQKSNPGSNQSLGNQQPQPRQNIFSSPNPNPNAEPKKPEAPLPNPYEFILNPANQPKQPIKLSSKQRILTIAGGGIVLLIIIIAFYSAVLNKKPNVTAEVSLEQQQYQLISISTQARSQANQQVTKNLAATVTAGLTTNQQQLTSYLSKKGIKISSKQLGAGLSASVTKQLQSAKNASDYDIEYVQITQNLLTKYTQGLDQTLGVTQASAERQVLQTSIAAAQLLSAQATQTSKTLLGT